MVLLCTHLRFYCCQCYFTTCAFIATDVAAPAGLSLLAAYMPSSVLYFAFKGHKVWLESTWSGDSSAHGERPPGRASMSLPGGTPSSGAPGPRPPRDSTSLDLMPRPPPRCSASLDLMTTPSGAVVLGVRRPQVATSFRLDPAAELGAEVPSSPKLMPSHPPSSGQASRRMIAAQQRRSVLSNQDGGLDSGKQQHGVMYGVKRLLLRCVTPAIAGVVGTVAYTVLLVVLVLALLWAWVTRTVFSVYCIFFPCAADTPCCLKLTRTGDFWSVADIQAAFAAAKLSVTHAQQVVHDASSHEASVVGKHGYDASCSVRVAHGRLGQ